MITTAFKIKFLNDTLDLQIESAIKALNTFKVRLTEDAYDAFSWGEVGIQAACMQKVCCEVKALISSCTQPDVVVETVANHLLRSMASHARFGTSSTSRISNVTDLHLTQAYASLYDLLRGLQK